MRIASKLWLVAILVVVAAAFVGSVPVWAGHWELKYTPNASISLRLEGNRIVGIVNPAFGPDRGGKMELRIAGVPCRCIPAPPYEFVLDLAEPISPLVGKEYAGFGSFAVKKGLDYLIEAYVIGQDGKRKWAAPTVTFRIDEVADLGQGSRVSQSSETPMVDVKELAKKAYEAGYRAGLEKASVPALSPPAIAKVVVKVIGVGSTEVLVRDSAGDHQLTVQGTAEMDVKPGPVSLFIRQGSGLTLSGQPAVKEATAGETVVWILERRDSK
ncbi:MAG: hypothetical protein NT135_02360 [Candidatus Berkelbacteria bacterium]|nr:hypothetical protein [Candidatus Berkelbacteria bacterium]